MSYDAISNTKKLITGLAVGSVISLLSLNANAAVYHAKFPVEGGYIKVEVLADDIMHVEMAAGNGPDVSQAIYHSPMVADTNTFTGPSQITHNENIIETPELKLEVSANCLIYTDKVRSYEMTRVCLDSLGDRKTIGIKKGFTENAYGLGQLFRDLGQADGDLLQHGVWDTDGDYGNHFKGFYGGANSQIQFPILYALGDDNRNFAFLLDNVYDQNWNFEGDWWHVNMWGEHIRYYIMAGEDLLDLRSDYLEITGRPPVPPKKAFGLWLSEFGFDNWQEVDGNLSSMRENNFPIDGFVLDLQWFGGAWNGSPDSPMGGLNWDTNAFPNPEDKIAAYTNDDIGLITIEESYVAKNQWSFQQMKNRGAMVQKCSGGDVMFDAWVGYSGVIDWSNKAGRDWWHDTLRQNNIINKGIIGHWTDLGEPERFDAGACYSGAEEGKHNHSDIHNIYNTLWLEGMYEGYQRHHGENDQRMFVMTRAGSPGVQRFGASMWSGDIASRLDVLNTHNNASMHMSFSGIDYYGSDTAGFWRREVWGDTANSNGWRPSEGEMYTQWLANSSWFDIPFRVHTYNCGFSDLDVGPINCPYEITPSTIGDSAANLMNIRQRYELVPYYYSLAFKAYSAGEPVIAPVVMYYQNDDNVRTMGNQKLIGSSIMVATVASHGMRERNIYLPAGKWFNYHTNEEIQSSGQWIENQAAQINGHFTLPAYVTAGAIIPIMHVDALSKDVFGNRTDDSRNTDFIVKLYAGDAASEFTVYEDDGKTVDSYENSVPQYQHRTTLVTQQTTEASAQVVLTSTGDFDGAVQDRNNEIRYLNTANVASAVILNGVVLPHHASFDDYAANDSGWFIAGDKVLWVKTGVLSVSLDKTIDVLFVGAGSPVAKAGLDRQINIGDSIELDASSSSDSDGNIVAYQWNIPLLDLSLSGEKVAVTFDTAGVYSVELTVTDNDAKQATDLVTITVVDPSACEYRFEQVLFRGTANQWSKDSMEKVGACTWQTLQTFSGSSDDRFKFDIKGDWTENYGSTTASNSETSGDVVSFGSDIFVSVAGVYRVQMNDQTMTYSYELVTGNLPPVAKAGQDITVASGQMVTFDGSASIDSDGDIVSYSWSNELSGSVASLRYDLAGVYSVILTVTDNEGATAQDTIQVTVAELPALVDVGFTCNNVSVATGHSVYVVGSIAELGPWSVKSESQLLTLSTGNAWTGVVSLPVNQALAWKCVVANDGSKVITQWQNGSNNSDQIAESNIALTASF